jgi:hypothetical protein
MSECGRNDAHQVHQYGIETSAGYFTYCCSGIVLPAQDGEPVLTDEKIEQRARGYAGVMEERDAEVAYEACINTAAWVRSVLTPQGGEERLRDLAWQALDDFQVVVQHAACNALGDECNGRCDDVAVAVRAALEARADGEERLRVTAEMVERGPFEELGK